MTAWDGRSGIAPLFATPFAALNTGADSHFNAQVVNLCESQRARSAPPSDPLHFRGRDDFLDSSDAPVSDLKRHILSGASTVVASLTSMATADFARLRIHARGWCSIVLPGGHVPAQHFSGASWLAMYCAQAGDPDEGSSGAGVLRLYERRMASVYRDAGNAELNSPYRYGNHTWTPAPGMMALFPAHLPHEVSVVRSAIPLVLVFAMIRFTEPDAPGIGPE